jgi:RNA polymerase sigma-70 factor (ECF subfamily)
MQGLHGWTWEFPSMRLNWRQSRIQNHAMESGSLDREGPEAAPSDCNADTGARALEVERLFRDHNAALIRFLTLRLHSRQEAREVAQEAYVRLLQLERTDLTSFVRAYLFRIAGNLAIDRLRRRATESRFRETEPFPGLFERPVDPEALAAEDERVEQIREFLHELPDAVRNAFLLFRVEDMEQESIARRLGITDRTVRNHITRALMYCRLRMEGLAPAEAASRLKIGTTR